MEQPTNDLRQAPTRLETSERELAESKRELAMSKATAEANVEVAKRELAESKAKLEVAEANRAAHAFLSDEWKFYNEEVTAARAMVASAWAMVTSAGAMVTSAGAMVLKLTPAPGTYSPPPLHTHTTHNPLVDSLAASAKKEGGVAPARRTHLGCVLRVESPLSAHGSGASSSEAAKPWVELCDPAVLHPPLALVALLVGGEVWGYNTLQERGKEGEGCALLATV